ncbi:MAG: nucleotidyltransferase domain-containing protein [Armatimonadetes bacterium]|nr:nucleotidyltransferase domain-containing protein [Armatimonadota bacterium]
MVTRQQIDQLGQKIAAEFRPRRIVLFGSYACGSPRDDSDVDLLLVMPHGGRAVGRAAEVARTIHGAFDVDIVVRSPEEIAQRLALGDRFMGEILEKGQVLYEAPDL